MPMPAQADSQPDLFVPVGVLPDWTQTMRRATQAHHNGQWVMAQTQYQMALGMARGLVVQGGEGALRAGQISDSEADACVCACVSSHLCLASLLAEEGCTEQAAATLAQAHLTLLALIRQHPLTDGWHRAAVWHGRDTHAALLAHRAEHGDHPDIDRALRAGCLTLTTAACQRTGVH